MEQALLSLLNGIPIAAAVLYVWIVSEKSHKEEIKEWRLMLQKKDDGFEETLKKLQSTIDKLTYIIDNYVLRNRKNTAGKQD